MSFPGPPGPPGPPPKSNALLKLEAKIIKEYRSNRARNVGSSKLVKAMITVMIKRAPGLAITTHYARSNLAIYRQL